MAITKLLINDYLQLSKTSLVIDVRSPGEYAHAHIPTVHNLPLFTDAERKIIGTAYKQQSKQIAIKLGLDFFGVKMKLMIEQTEQLMAAHLQKYKQLAPDTESQTLQANTIFVHCWRGGMRSAGVAWLLSLYGYTVYTLIGGYKAYRNWALQQFEKPYTLKIIGGYTGSGKTLLLAALQKENIPTIDLEGLANHKGSALGGIGQLPQPSQEMFENNLAKELFEKIDNTPTNTCLWLEDESQRIGNLQIPIPFWKTMRSSKLYFLNIPFKERLQYLTDEYGIQKKEALVAAIMRIQKRLGGLETKTAINFLLEDNYRDSFSILLTYYDKYYAKGLYNRDNAAELITTIEAEKVDTNYNLTLLKN